ncbi:hypothetical protein JB92DRAFT_3053874 [Gautieria morchelliformis]|nr:hypothetical protein JB92DRAFT_3053874 [Gautieria morchelliformis]
MEEYPVASTSMITSSSKGGVSATDRGDEDSGRDIMKTENLGHKDEEPKWEVSPERTTSLLPPFGAGQLAHLPTPQSPADLANYLSGPTGSPEGPRSGHIRYLPSHLPPSRPTSAHSPQTPHRGRSTLDFKRPPLFSAPRELKHGSHPGELEYARLPLSQVATPSPEVSRTRHASVPSTASDPETILATPKFRRRSSSQTHSVPTSLAPAPIISPANSSHSTKYHASPVFEKDESQSSRTYHFPRGMAALAPEHDVQVGVRDHGHYDLDDPFIVRAGEGRGEALSRQQYPSPPPKKPLQHFAAHASAFQNATEQKHKGSSENSIAKHITFPSESSDSPSFGSPVKIEVDDRAFDIPIEPSVTHTVYGGTLSRTPPRVASGGASVLKAHTPTLENTVLRTPQHLSRGEIGRIRQGQAALEEICLSESEKRRPDYLMRIKRAREAGDEEAAETERENALPGLGVTISPFRGRRLKLYQPVAIPGKVISEEPGAGTDEAAEPKTPPPISTVPKGSVPSWQSTVPAMSLRAIDWHTPRGPSSPVARTEENEHKKQKRLLAFAAPAPSGKGHRLKPAEIAGQGRVIIDVTSEESRKLAEAGVLRLFETPGTDSVEEAELSLSTGHGAEWPDKEYPWSVQERQRDEYETARRRQRLTWIERFFDRESESEDEEKQCVAGPSTWNQPIDQGSFTRAQRGYGQSISVNAAPNSKRSRGARQISFNAANTDAREVLMSKKHVRTVLERLRKRKMAEEEDGVVMCICQGADDGRPMVRCDECRTWYHLICMDIHDESELGDEWYCWKCLPSAGDPSPAPPIEPTFAPVRPDSPPRAGVGDQPLYQSALQPSPMPASPIAQRRDLSPTRRSRLPHALGDSDPVRGGPSTPYLGRTADSRLYSPPKLYDEYRTDDHVPFDPTSTPSRGLKFPNPVPVTPRRQQHPWTPAPSLSWTTHGPPRTPQFVSQSGSSSARSLAHSLSTSEDSVGPLTSPWPADDSPTRKPARGTDPIWPYTTSRRVLDSPLAVQSADRRPFPLGADESPTPRHFYGLKDTELASRAGHSPHQD